MARRYQKFDPRQYMKRTDFEIFYGLDDQPPDVDLHHHDFYEVYLFLKGKIEYRVEGRIYHLKPGDLLLISPMELHQLIAKEDGGVYERIVLWVNREFLERFSDGDFSLTRCFDSTMSAHTNLLQLTSGQRAEVQSRLENLVRESYGKEYGNELCASGILIQFMVELNRIALRGSGRQTAREESSPLVSQVLDYIGEHYDEDLTLEGLAQRFYVSKYHLSHEFSRVVGTGVYRYIVLKRLLIAKQMLANGIAPGVVYSNCGFRDYANFYRAFKSRYGVGPRNCMGASQ